MLIGLGVGGYLTYKVIYQPNVFLGERKSQLIFIPTGSDFNDVGNILSAKGIVINRTTFELLAETKKYDNNVKPGRYRILARMNNNYFSSRRNWRQDLPIEYDNNIELFNSSKEHTCSEFPTLLGAVGGLHV